MSQALSDDHAPMRADRLAGQMIIATCHRNSANLPSIPFFDRNRYLVGCGAEPSPRPVAWGSWRDGNRVSAPSVTRPWTITRSCTCTTWFPRNTEARTTSRIYGWCITTATARFTAPAPLLGYVDGLSHVPGDRCARFCGEGMIAISSPYPTSWRKKFLQFVGEAKWSARMPGMTAEGHLGDPKGRQ
jgi:hypothetical protein